MIRILLLLSILGYVSVVFVYPNVQFDHTNPKIEFLGERVGEDYIVNINESNLLKIYDDTELKDVVLYLSNKDTNNKFEKIYYNRSGGKKENLINLNKTILKKILSSYISSIKLKVVATDASLSKNETTRVFNIKLDNRKPLLKIVNKSLFPLSKGSLISLRLDVSDKESRIKNIKINGKMDYTIVRLQDNHYYDLLIPVDEEIIKGKSLSIEVFDTVGNKSSLKTYFLTKNNQKTYNIDDKQNFLKNYIEEMRIKLETSKIDIPSLYQADRDVINHIISDVAKEINLGMLTNRTLAETEVPVHKNDKRTIIAHSSDIMFGGKQMQNDGAFYMANKYQEIISPLDGQIVFLGHLNTLGETIIIKNKQGLYTTFSLLDGIDNSLEVGKPIKKGTTIAKPKFSNLFNANLYMSINLNGTYINPYYLFDREFYKDNLAKVFEKGEKE